MLSLDAENVRKKKKKKENEEREKNKRRRKQHFSPIIYGKLRKKDRVHLHFVDL